MPARNGTIRSGTAAPASNLHRTLQTWRRPKCSDSRNLTNRLENIEEAQEYFRERSKKPGTKNWERYNSQLSRVWKGLCRNIVEFLPYTHEEKIDTPNFNEKLLRIFEDFVDSLRDQEMHHKAELEAQLARLDDINEKMKITSDNFLKNDVNSITKDVYPITLEPVKTAPGSALDCQVGSFRFPENGIPAAENRKLIQHIEPEHLGIDSKFAVKRVLIGRTGEDLSQEIKILKQIWQHGSHPHLQRILFHDVQELEIGTLPVGQSLDHRKLSSKVARNILSDTLDAIIWLHHPTRWIIHRDVRWDNIIITEGFDTYGHRRDIGVLVNCGNSIQLPADAEKTGFWTLWNGGIECMGPELLRKLQYVPDNDDEIEPYISYRPRKRDDYYAFVVLINRMMFPKAWQGLDAKSLLVFKSIARDKLLKNFWYSVGEQEDNIWKNAADCARNEDVDGLRKIISCCQWPSSI